MRHRNKMDIKYTLQRQINLNTLIRQMGYHPIVDRRTNTQSWVRLLSSGFYPRFHMYITLQPQSVHLSLHIDQKKQTMDLPGLKRHAGEYNSPVVQAEGARLQRWLDYSQKV